MLEADARLRLARATYGIFYRKDPTNLDTIDGI